MRPALLLMMLQGPAHGYELSERMGKFGIADIDPSLIYRALRTMEESRLVTSDWDEEKTQGPPRRVYTITAEGKDALQYYMDELRATRDRIDQLLSSFGASSADDSSQSNKKGDG